MARGPLCVRLPPDIHAAVESLAETAGITASEWVRDQLFRVVYGEPPGIDQGYIAGRNLGYRAMSLIFRDAIKIAVEQMPTDVESAQHLLQLGSPGRTPHED